MPNSSLPSRGFLAAAVLSLALALPLATPAAAKAPKGSYDGRTSQGYKAAAKVANGRVKKLTIAYSAKCANGTYLNSGGFVFNTLKLKGRAFSAKGTSDGRLADGNTYVSNITMSGRFNRKGSSAKGTARFDIDLTTNTGLTTCTTKKLSFTLTRR